MSQANITVVCDAGGLHLVEPRASIQERLRIRVSNGVVDLKPRERFTIVVANYSRVPRTLARGTVIAMAAPNPMGIYSLDEDAILAFEKVLNLPLEREVTPQASTSAKADAKPPAKEEGDWRESVHLAHFEDTSLKEQILEMLAKHQARWKPGRLGTITATEHRIELAPDTRPIRSMTYRQGPAMRERVSAEVDKMLKAGVIELSTAEWASPVVLVPKKDGLLCFCVTYLRLNAKTVCDAYPLLRIDDCIDSLGDATIFSTLDYNAGYWQIHMARADRDKTNFTTFLGTYRHKRMPFGLNNAPATFKHAVDLIFAGLRRQVCLINLDDVIVLLETVKDHLGKVDNVLQLLQKAGVPLKLRKCAFFQPLVDYLGRASSPGKLTVASQNAEAVCKALFPTNITQLRLFLGAANVYRRFIHDYSKIFRPLNRTLSKDANPEWWDDPTEDQRCAFKILKEKLVTPPVLSLPMKGRPFMIDTDASAYQLGVELLQQEGPNDAKSWAPIGFWSKNLTAAERNYSSTERECLSVVWAVTSQRPYIEGLKFTVRTDHDALRWLLTISDATERLMSWRLRLFQLDFSITYRPGLVHPVADALSRIVTSRRAESTVDEEVPTYGDHESALITTRARSASEQQRLEAARAASGVASCDATPDGLEDAVLDDTVDDERDIFDATLAEKDKSPEPITEGPLALTLEDLVEAQK